VILRGKVWEQNLGKMGDKEEVGPLMTAATMFLNFTVSVLIIWVNKYVYKSGFRWNTSMTVLHFAATYLGLWISAKFFGFFKPIHCPVKKVLPISLAFCGFVIFNNLSLQYNPVGVYQLLKVLTTPVVVILQLVLHGTKLPYKQACALVPTCIGVALATVTHLEANMWGSIFGTIGIISTSLYQIWVKTEKDNLKLDPPQLLFNQAKVSFWILLVLAPFCEDVIPDPWRDAVVRRLGLEKYFEIKRGNQWLSSKGGDALLDMQWYKPEVLAAVLLTAVLAFIVNLSIFLTIAYTTPVSYNVLGHAKLCCILISGYVLFGETATEKNILGVCLAVCGIMWYTHLRMQPSEPSKLAEDAKKKD